MPAAFFRRPGFIIPSAVALFFLLIACAVPKAETPSLPAGKLLPTLDSIRARLQQDLHNDAAVTLVTTRDSTDGAADSTVTYRIDVPRPAAYYSITFRVRYFARSGEAEQAFKGEYMLFHDKQLHTEGTLSPEEHYRIGNCIADVHYGCVLSRTNSEKLLLALLDRLYQEEKAQNSFYSNHCGGGGAYSPDLK